MAFLDGRLVLSSERFTERVDSAGKQVVMRKTKTGLVGTAKLKTLQRGEPAPAQRRTRAMRSQSVIDHFGRGTEAYLDQFGVKDEVESSMLTRLSTVPVAFQSTEAEFQRSFSSLRQHVVEPSLQIVAQAKGLATVPFQQVEASPTRRYNQEDEVEVAFLIVSARWRSLELSAPEPLAWVTI
ncbi:BZ3500_MvSof-1268-A1-R1_Chr3-3g06575 [Microbotryum saponariae]|uniref:BZ3500_MvSof-1268-A1-R1_Chr3-3g06575 protein n=1 Tax=Microbotryum saponariae TaxID=289078 RepID=A0A2X0NAR7_9BASI|nr:BZ3500_MvSof-1268-A1-R1_Chr3-3g06575 [Microbotryum saponariae]SDA04542.1 BZ3501_MvSof-1269-A2-R1_Chr3-2g06262 [Microbotryum saponariae]